MTHHTLIGFLLLTSTAIAAQDDTTSSTYRDQLASEAMTVAPLAKTELGRAFLNAADDLSPMTERRTVYFRGADRTAISPEMFTLLGEEDRADFREMPVTESRYYGLYSTPIAYLRALECVGEAGLTNVDGKRIADFGFGNIGQLRMLASLGADVVGIEIDGVHDVIYRMPSDQGAVPRSPDAGKGNEGSVTLVFGRYPTTEQIRNAVGGDLTLFMSKNTLKKGYIHPEREADPRQLIDLGVDDQTYVRSVYDALAPGGWFVIYNLYPKPAAPDEPYIPWASGECPFDRELMTTVGFEIIRWNEDDSKKARAMGRALGWNEGLTDEEFAEGFNAMVTIARKPADAASRPSSN
ncbi:MAG: hypothetical protein AAF432_02870 [Planctomycetota bacterium]